MCECMYEHILGKLHNRRKLKLLTATTKNETVWNMTIKYGITVFNVEWIRNKSYQESIVKMLHIEFNLYSHYICNMMADCSINQSQIYLTLISNSHLNSRFPVEHWPCNEFTSLTSQLATVSCFLFGSAANARTLRLNVSIMPYI